MIDDPVSAQTERAHLSMCQCPIYVYKRLIMSDNIDERSYLLSLPIQMLIFLGNIFTNTPRKTLY